MYALAFSVDRIAFGPFGFDPSISTSLRHDFFCSALEIIDGRKILSHIMFFGGTFWLSKNMPDFTLNDYFLQAPWLGLVFYFFIFDFFLYWSHRINHLHPFWVQHSYHHSPVMLNPLSANRVHALSKIVSILFLIFPMSFIYKLPDKYFLSSYALFQLWSIIKHSRWNTSFGWLGQYIFVNPRFHRIHHAVDVSQHSNYGHYLVIWDRLFKTYTDPKNAFQLRIGLVDNPFSNSKESVIVAYFKVYPRFLKAVLHLFMNKT